MRHYAVIRLNMVVDLVQVSYTIMTKRVYISGTYKFSAI